MSTKQRGYKNKQVPRCAFNPRGEAIPLNRAAFRMLMKKLDMSDRSPRKGFGFNYFNKKQNNENK